MCKFTYPWSLWYTKFNLSRKREGLDEDDIKDEAKYGKTWWVYRVDPYVHSTIRGEKTTSGGGGWAGDID